MLKKHKSALKPEHKPPLKIRYKYTYGLCAGFRVFLCFLVYFGTLHVQFAPKYDHLDQNDQKGTVFEHFVKNDSFGALPASMLLLSC